jgi:hypothetical protein
MKKFYSVLLAVLLATAVLVPAYAVADDNVPASTVQDKVIEGPDVE